jgi:type III pantothenate kinase
MKRLLLDLGNSKLKWALVSGGAILESGERSSFSAQWLTSFLSMQPDVSEGLLSSVTVTGEEVRAAFPADFRLLEVRPEGPLPIRSAYKTPQTLGRDRLAAVLGAWSLFPGEHVLVVDAGTCLKYDLLDAAGLYRGGAISPGISMRFEALHSFTERLPRLSWSGGLASFPGVSSEGSIRAGVEQGVLHEVRGFWTDLLKQVPDARLVITGGDGGWLAKNLGNSNFARPFLVFHGLDALSNFYLNLPSDAQPLL